MQDFSAWIGRSETLSDVVGPTPVIALNATLDHDPVEVPIGTHLPSVRLPRRTWAGGQFEFRAPELLGDDVSPTSTIEDVTTRLGHSAREREALRRGHGLHA